MLWIKVIQLALSGFFGIRVWQWIRNPAHTSQPFDNSLHGLLLHGISREIAFFVAEK